MIISSEPKGYKDWQLTVDCNVNTSRLNKLLVITSRLRPTFQHNGMRYSTAVFLNGNQISECYYETWQEAETGHQVALEEIAKQRFNLLSWLKTAFIKQPDINE